MKSLITILGVAGSVCAIMLGSIWLSEYYQYKDSIEQNEEFLMSMGVSEEQTSITISGMRNNGIASYLMLAGGILSLIASFTVSKFARIAGAVLVASALLPALFSFASLLGTCLLIPAGILALSLKYPSGSLNTLNTASK